MGKCMCPWKTAVFPSTVCMHVYCFICLCSFYSAFQCIFISTYVIQYEMKSLSLWGFWRLQQMYIQCEMCCCCGLQFSAWSDRMPHELWQLCFKSEYMLYIPMFFSFSLPSVWSRRGHKAAIWPSVHGAHKNRFDAWLQLCVHTCGRGCSHVEPYSGRLTLNV